MSVEQTWNPTITEIMQLFRESVIQLLPVMEKAHLRWREGETYDEWDRIVTSLFEGIVVSSLQWGLRSGEFTEIEIPAYDMVYSDYRQFSFIELLGDTANDNAHLLFHKFVTDKDPFDTIRCYEVDHCGRKLRSDPVMRPVTDGRFAFCHRQSPTGLVRYESLSICISREGR